MFSVVIPLFNKEKSVPDTIRSVLEQTWSDFELIIINDGSTDTSREKAARFSDPRIQIIDQENLGVSAARNAGIRVSSNPYIAFMDGDDIWEPNYLETQKELIKDFPNSGMWGIGMGVLRKNQKYPFYHGLPRGYRGLIKNYFTMEKKGMLFRPSGTVVCKNVFNSIGLFDERIGYGEDLDIIYRILFQYQPAFYNMNISYYRTDAENSITNKSKPIHTRFFYFIDKYKKHRVEDKNFRIYFDRVILAYMYEYRLTNEYKEEVGQILEKIDFSHQNFRWRLVYSFPGLYKIYARYLK